MYPLSQRPLVQALLEVDEGRADIGHVTQLAHGIAHAVVLELDQTREFVDIQFGDAARLITSQYERKE